MTQPIVLRVRQVREALGISQRELARRAGVTVSTVSRIETGKVALIDLAVLDKLARALDVDPAILVVRARAANEREPSGATPPQRSPGKPTTRGGSSFTE